MYRIIVITIGFLSQNEKKEQQQQQKTCFKISEEKKLKMCFTRFIFV